jgi:adenosylcobyric acid synthase
MPHLGCDSSHTEWAATEEWEDAWVTGLLVAGTSSDAGKSLIVAGLCRAWARQGIKVAPFKAQNMSNNSMVCPDGSEIGRAQYLQAIAAGVEPSSVHNPVLLKPATDRRAFIVLRGQPGGTLEAGDYVSGRTRLAEAAFEAYGELESAYDLVVCEGAGSPAEINLRKGDYVNLGLAREFGLPVVLVGDIDRGGVLASIFGHWGIVDAADRALLAGYLINKFRGDQSVLDPGLDELTARTGLRCFGVMPWLNQVWLDSEDALAFAKWPRLPGRAGTLRVAAIRFPRISNATDLDALAAEPGLDVFATASPADITSADLVVLPGSRSTLADLAWLRELGLADALLRRASAGGPILGICGGYQMLTETIDDPVESRLGTEAGLGLLPARVRFSAEKLLGRPRGEWRGNPVVGYEIHHGVVEATGGEPFLDGIQVGNTWGTIWHGAFENDDFRRAWLAELAVVVGSSWRPAEGAPGFAERRTLMLDSLADALEQNVDLHALLALSGGY